MIAQVRFAIRLRLDAATTTCIMQIMEGGVICPLRANSAYIGHLHTVGNLGRNELDASQELYCRAIVATEYGG